MFYTEAEKKSLSSWEFKITLFQKIECLKHFLWVIKSLIYAYVP